MTGHSFDDAVALQHTAPGRMRAKTSPDWANMVGPFGGLTAALMLRAVEEQPDRIGEPLSLTVNFAAPITDGDLDITATAVRTNRTNQHWLVELSQDGVVTTTATTVFGIRRDSWSETEASPWQVPAPEEIAPTGLHPTIAWARNFEMRFVEGAVPGADAEPSPSSVSTLWVRDVHGRGLDFASLTAVSDVFYPRVYLRRGAVSPAGTISLTTYFHADSGDLAALGGDFVLARAHASRFSRGYFDQSAQLWSRAGELLVSTHQMVYFKT